MYPMNVRPSIQGAVFLFLQVMDQLPLFDLPKPHKDKICKQCKHLFRHQYNSDMKYCSQQGQKGTAYGYKKIKSNDRACYYFEQKLK